MNPQAVIAYLDGDLGPEESEVGMYTTGVEGAHTGDPVTRAAFVRAMADIGAALDGHPSVGDDMRR